MDLFQANPTTTLVCISRTCATKLNSLCQKAFLPEREIIALRLCEEGADPQKIPLQNGLPARLTRNLNKRSRLVNGTAGTVRDVFDRTALVEIRGVMEPIRLWSERGRRFFPLARSYADTLAKRQGMTLPHVTIMPDVDYVPAAAYVGISRARGLDDAMFLVRPDRAYFQPAAALS